MSSLVIMKDAERSISMASEYCRLKIAYKNAQIVEINPGKGYFVFKVKKKWI